MHLTMAELEEKSVSVHHSIAEYYWLDARDFLSRFDALWDVETHKTGRIKTFVDLLMGCECALKSHLMLGLAWQICAQKKPIQYSATQGTEFQSWLTLRT